MKNKLFMRNNKGSTIIIFSFALTLILSLSAVVVDVGNTIVEKQKLQNAIDSAVLAAAQELPDTDKASEVAYQYMQLNGFKEDDVTISFSDNNRTIGLSGNKNVDFYFARILGMEGTTAHTHAAASLESMGEAFNYVLFSGSKNTALTINGGNAYIEGSCHTNYYGNLNGSNFNITGEFEASKLVTVNGSNINIGSKISNAPYVDMPDFSELIKAQAEDCGQVYVGNKIFDGSDIEVDSPLFVKGDVIVNGSHFKGKGCILATGNIIFNGSNLYDTSGDSVCFYSQNGDITVNGANAVLDGLLYAPNGCITFNGSNQTINGRAIGSTVQFNGSGLSVVGGTSELESLPSNGVKLVR